MTLEQLKDDISASAKAEAKATIDQANKEAKAIVDEAKHAQNQSNQRQRVKQQKMHPNCQKNW